MFEFLDSIAFLIASILGFIEKTIADFIELVSLSVKMVIFLREVIFFMPLFLRTVLIVFISIYAFKFVARMGK